MLRSHVPDSSESLQRMASQEVYVCFEERLGWNLLASRPQLGDVQVPELVAGLPACGAAAGLERLSASFVTFPPLPPGLLPGFFGDARPRLVPVLSPGALLLGSRARTAPMTLARQGRGSERTRLTRGFTLRAGDGNRTRTISLGICTVRAATPSDLRGGWSASDRERPLATGVNGPLMARNLRVARVRKV